jgi:GNAT superfamily N-acetyltransferase
LRVDPYAGDPHVGRLRHVYVARNYRRHGVGRALVERLMAEALTRFVELRLRTHTAEGHQFYRSLGFCRVDDQATATHILPLRG